MHIWIDRIMRLGTGVMLGAFLVIILTTTFSTADWVATLGKVMYWVIIGIALFSFCMWAVRRWVGSAGLGSDFDESDAEQD